MRSLTLGLLCVGAIWSQVTVRSAEATELVADEPQLIVSTEQGWGVLGLNVAAHQSNIPGQPLRIGDKTYATGLGHHANGQICIALDGLYTAFEADIGLQPCSGGSVIFRVLVDGVPRFESPVIHSGEEPKHVLVDVTGAQGISLQAEDGGDGMACDMANWAEAKLIPTTDVKSPMRSPLEVDIAPFARTVTWDATRTNGATASRVEEFLAEDIYTETELRPNRDGSCTLPSTRQTGTRCIGLQWLEQRHLRRAELAFPSEEVMPQLSAVRLEAWVGESAWQGTWVPLKGELTGSRTLLTFAPERRFPVISRKLRWILPPDERAVPVRLFAFSRSRWIQTNIWVQLEQSRVEGKGTVSIYNGQLLSSSGEPVSKLDLHRAELMRIRVTSCRPMMFQDPTVLRFQLPAGEISVSMVDVMSNDCVYVPTHGLFVTRDPAPVRLEDYKRRISGKKTILEEVREMPDQTRSQAMQKTHHDFQRLGPVMLSLAANNSKFILERDGLLKFQVVPFDWNTDWGLWTQNAWQLVPRFGTGRNDGLKRFLDGGWLPIPVISVVEDGVRYSQRTFVAPVSDNSHDPGLGTAKAVCVVEWTCVNELSKPAQASLSLRLASSKNRTNEPSFTKKGSRWEAAVGERPVLFLGSEGEPDFLQQTSGNELRYSGIIPAGSKLVIMALVMGDHVQREELPAEVTVSKFRERTEDHWQRLLNKGMQIGTPDEWLNNTIRSSVVRCFIAARNEGQGERVAASIAAMSYGPLESEAHSVIRGMDFMGQTEFTKRSLNYFIHRYNTNGFLTTGYTTFGTAWHLWTIGEHFGLTHDKAWLEQNASEIARVCHWIIRQTDKTKRLEAGGKPRPEFGLMPPGVLADWNAFAYHFAMNGYYCAALREAGQALRQIGYPDAHLFLNKAAELQQNTLKAYAWTESRAPVVPLRNGTWIPYYPSQVHSPGKLADFFPGQDAGRSWAYDVELGAHQLVPTGVLKAHDPRVTRMLDHMEDAQFLADGWFDYPAVENQRDWFNLGGFSKVQPYYTRNAEIYAMRDDVKPFIRSYFNTLAAMISPEVLTFWEHFHDSGAYDKTHETGYFLHQTRTMLVQERGEELWLAPFIPGEWLKPESRLLVENAPTTFGNAGYEMLSSGGRTIVHIKPPPQAPRHIVLRLSQLNLGEIAEVTLNGKKLRSFDRKTGTIRLKPSLLPMNVEVSYANPKP